MCRAEGGREELFARPNRRSGVRVELVIEREGKVRFLEKYEGEEEEEERAKTAVAAAIAVVVVVVVGKG